MIFGPEYFQLAFLIWYIDIILAGIAIFRELFHRFSSDRRAWVLFLILLIGPLLNVPYVPDPNSSTHKNLANEISQNPVTYLVCNWYQNGDCVKKDQVVWSYAYHIALAPFMHLGDFGIQLFNSVCVFVAASFLFFMLKDRKHSTWFLSAIFIPFLYLFFASPVLDFLSWSLGIALVYFIDKFKNQKSHLLEAVLVAMLFLHVRPENFIYVAIFMVYLFKDLLSSRKLGAFLFANLLLKVFEYFRGISTEWTANPVWRFETLVELLPHNIWFLFNPIRFNLLFSILILFGLVRALRQKDFPAAILPIAAIAIYTTKQPYGLSFNLSSVYSSKYLLNFMAMGVPLVLKGLDALKPHRIMSLMAFLVMIPFAGGISFESVWQNAPMTGLTGQDIYDLIDFADSNNMTVFSIEPTLFLNAHSSAMIADVFSFPTGDYLAIEPSNFFISQHASDCDITKITGLGLSGIYNFSCIQKPEFLIS